MANQFRPDETNMRPKLVKKPNDGPNDPPNVRDRLPRGVLASFMPGGQGLLAQQLSNGYGGNAKAISQQLGNVYSPMKIPNFQYGGGDGTGGKNGKDGKDGKDVTPDLLTPDSPGRNNLATLSGQSQQLTPEMIAMIRQRLMTRG